MLKNIISGFLISCLTLSVTTITFPQVSYAHHLSETISVYSVTYNKHGRVVKTSVGTFYIGKSGDVILKKHSGRTLYGYWEERSGVTYVYVGDEHYRFSF